MSGFTQYFTESPNAGTAMHHRDVAAGAMNLERGFGRGILAADDHDALPVVRMRFLVEVRDVRQILAGNVEHVRLRVIAHREHDVARLADARHAARGARLDGKRLAGRRSAAGSR